MLPPNIYIFSRLSREVIAIASCFDFTLTHHRVLLAGIRNLGACPCPRCLIPLSRVHNIGMPLDMKQRRTQARVDNPHRIKLVQDARKKIYCENRSVTSKAVNDLLKIHSLVPTVVRMLIILIMRVLNRISRTPFPTGCMKGLLICFQCLLWI